jgi:hypothetical protein
MSRRPPRPSQRRPEPARCHSANPLPDHCLVGPATSPLEIWRAKPYVSCGIVARWDSLPPTTGFIPQPVRYSAYPRAGLLAAVS